jgi:glucose dehydrogenase
MKKLNIFFLIISIILLSSCDLGSMRNKLSKNESILNFYSLILKTKSKVSNLYNVSVEIFLLKFSEEHKNHWKIEDQAERAILPEYKFLDLEKNPTISIKKNEDTLNHWYRSHGNHSSNRFSELEMINKNNVHNLEIDWIFNSGEPQSIQSNPIVVDGIIYTPISGNYIAAIDGYNGKLIWKSKKFKSTLAKRGLIYWKDPNSEKERIFFSNEKNLISLNIRDGAFDSNFGSNGLVRTGVNLLPPVIYNNQIIIATLAPEHYIESYDIFSGKLIWKLRYKKIISKRVGGVKYENSQGNPWGGSSLDSSRGIFFIGTGNPSLYMDGTRRPGLNKDANSIIAIDLKNRKKIWSFQETRHDLWNLDLASPPILTSLKKDNKIIDVVISPTKSGNTIILDRLSGKPIFPFPLKRAETSSVPGEKTASYQPKLETPEPFEDIFFDIEDIRKKFQKKFLTKDYEFGWFKTPKLKKLHIRGGMIGGAQWPGASVDHKKNIMYVTSNNIAFETGLILVKQSKNRAPIYKSTHNRIQEKKIFPINNPPWGTLNAINLNEGKLLWKVPLGNYDTFTNNNEDLTGTENFGGTTVTRGGITITAGTLDKKIHFHDSENGKLLKSILMPYIGSAPPSTYSIDGEQFIIVHATGGWSLKNGYGKLVETGDALIGFKLKK